MRRSNATAASPRVVGRAFWSGTISFGLVSIPVNLYAAAHTRETGMKLVDEKGRPLGRQYVSEDDKKLSADDLVRGYETDKGKIVVITDEELDAVAPEMTRDIELREFVALDEIPATYYEHPYLLIPSGKSSKAYHLLAETMQGSKRAGIGTFVMRGHQYLAAIIADGGLLRLQTLRFAKEVRSPADLGLPRAPKKAKANAKLAKAIASLRQGALDTGALSDRYAEQLHELAEAKQKKKKDVIHLGAGQVDEDEAAGDSGNVVDLMKLIRQSLGAKNATVTTGDSPAPRAHPRKASHRAAHHAR